METLVDSSVLLDVFTEDRRWLEWSQAELTRLADPTITRELRSLPGVAEVEVSGKVERELTVEIDPSRMQAAQDPVDLDGVAGMIEARR